MFNSTSHIIQLYWAFQEFCILVWILCQAAHPQSTITIHNLKSTIQNPQPSIYNPQSQSQYSIHNPQSQSKTHAQKLITASLNTTLLMWNEPSWEKCNVNLKEGNNGVVESVFPNEIWYLCTLVALCKWKFPPVNVYIGELVYCVWLGNYATASEQQEEKNQRHKLSSSHVLPCALKLSAKCVQIPKVFCREVRICTSRENYVCKTFRHRQSVVSAGLLPRVDQEDQGCLKCDR